jgi:hypothetical protein
LTVNSAFNPFRSCRPFFRMCTTSIAITPRAQIQALAWEALPRLRYRA